MARRRLLEDERFKDISSGPMFTCALRLDGTPSCWGQDYGTPEPERIDYASVVNDSFVAIDTGWNYSCGLRADGTTTCWGDWDSDTGQYGDHGREWPPEGERFLHHQHGLVVYVRTQRTGRDRGLLGREPQRAGIPAGRREICRDQHRLIRYLRYPPRRHVGLLGLRYRCVRRRLRAPRRSLASG